jgi:hypothetical protein
MASEDAGWRALRERRAGDAWTWSWAIGTAGSFATKATPDISEVGPRPRSSSVSVYHALESHYHPRGRQLECCAGDV